MENLITDLPPDQNLASGNAIIIAYDIFILCLFLFELVLYKNRNYFREQMNNNQKLKLGPIRMFFLKLATSYQRRGMITVTAILFVISLIVVNKHQLITISELIAIGISYLIFLGIVFFSQKFFVRMDQFQDDIVSRYVDLIFYIILGHAFVLFSRMVIPPTLPIGLIGLIFALGLVFSVMIRAIANPASIRNTVSMRRKNWETASILKGMVILVLCELMILYLMVYNCYKIEPGFYYSNINRVLDAFDMLYYLIVSFATIGYGDIFPVPVNGQIYSQIVAMIIGLSSLFSTACFVGAVVSGAAEMARGVSGEDAIDLQKIRSHLNSEKENKS
ncbi:potassium channel family protein [Eubacteriaceae bacterium ES2]|nr:potassium channel family protein [Eubacteriaceae bacterium ES2]